MTESRKSNHQEVPDKQDVDALKHEVSHLRSRLSRALNAISQLRSLVEHVLKLPVPEKLVYISESIPQKRKYDPFPSSVMSAVVDPLPPIVPSSSPDAEIISDLDIAMRDTDFICETNTPVSPPPPVRVGRSDTFGSISSSEEDILATLFDDEFSKFSLPDVTNSLGMKVNTMPSFLEPSGASIEKLKDALAALPSSMQELLVDRLVATLFDPDGFKKQIEAVTSLLEAASEESRLHAGQARVSC